MHVNVPFEFTVAAIKLLPCLPLVYHDCDIMLTVISLIKVITMCQ